MRVALDTNILAYAEGMNGPSMQTSARAIIQRLIPSTTFLPLQSLGELFRVLMGKAGWPASKARDAILDWRDSFPVIETSDSVLVAALDLATDHRLNIWDSVILSAAAEAGCRFLLSEDMQDGFSWKGVTVFNPFTASRRELLESLFETPDR